MILRPQFTAPQFAAPATVSAPCEYEKEVACVCEKTETTVWRLKNETGAKAPVFFVSGMAIDADGAPNAYHKDNIGLDHVNNARQYPNRKPDKAKGKWGGVVTDSRGRPVVQGPSDPCPGYYVSPTSLFDSAYGESDPRRYVDSTRIPYVALPPEVAGLGDFCVVASLANGRQSGAIIADRCASGRAGEGSIKLAELLGINSNARNGGADAGVMTIVFPASGNRRPRTFDEIQHESARLLKQWGGLGLFTKLAAQPVAAPSPPKVPH